jgi:hypothetical protein
MRGGYGTSLVCFFLALFLLPSALAGVQLNMPNEAISAVPVHAKLTINEPILEKYSSSIKVSCKNCNVLFDPELRDEYWDIAYDGQKQIDLYVSSHVSPYGDETYKEAELSLVFDIDYEKLQADRPNIDIYELKEDPGKPAAKISKKFYGVQSKSEYDEPTLWGESVGTFTRDELENTGYKDELSYQDSIGVEKQTRYSVTVGQVPCYEPINDGDVYLCSATFSPRIIEQGHAGDPENSRLEPLSLGNAQGYALITAKVGKIQRVTDKNGDEHNFASITVSMSYSVLNSVTKENYHGSMVREAFIKEGNQDIFIEKSIQEFKSIANSYTRTAVGTAPRTHQAVYEYNLNIREKGYSEPEATECSGDDDCADGKRCTACGTCIKESKIVEPSDVTVEFKEKHRFSAKAMENTIHNIIRVETTFNPRFSGPKGKIDYCRIAAPGIEGYAVVAKMENEDSYAGFTNGRILDPRDRERQCPIDFAEDSTCNFLVAPKDRKKTVGALGAVSEEISLAIVKDGKEVKREDEKITLTPIKMDLHFKASGKQVQQGSQKVIKYRTENRNAKYIRHKIRLIGPGEISMKDLEGTVMYSNLKPGETDRIIYFPPVLGNFDIGKELSSLSMIDLQKEAAKAIAEDALLAYGGEYAENLQSAVEAGEMTKAEKAGLSALRKYFKRNPGSYNPEKALKYIRALRAAGEDAKKIDFIAKSLRMGKGAYDLSKIPKNTVDLRDDIKQATGVDDKNHDEKTWTESFAETGVTTINVLQTGVSILTFLPNKIPIAGKLSAGAQTAFSAMTNIWKANLKYVAKDEKIARAKEKFLPAMILITAEDESGWQVSKGYIVQVAYHEI